VWLNQRNDEMKKSQIRYTIGTLLGEKYLIAGTITIAAKNNTTKQPNRSPIK